MDNEILITLTADIVSAHVSHNSVELGQLPKLIQSVYHAMAAAGQPAPAIEHKPAPAVSVRASVKPTAITCLDCGKKLKMLK
jgi:predicted transcriptional regulator